MTSTKTINATLWTKLPAEFHWRGETSAWSAAARPGQYLHSFLEGPSFDRDGNLIVADVPHGRLFRISPDGDWSLALEYDGNPHSAKSMLDGRFAIADYKEGLLAVDVASGVTELLADGVNTEAFRGLSDLCVADNGDIWFTDSGRTSLSDPTGRVFCLRTGGRLELCLDNAPYPNGIALSPNGSDVYVAMTRSNAIWKFSAKSTHIPSPMVGLWVQLSGGLGPDGLAIDAHGRVASAQAQAGRVYIFSSLGDLLATVHTPGGLWTTAVTFSGDGLSLFITEAQNGGIYRADLSAINEEI